MGFLSKFLKSTGINGQVLTKVGDNEFAWKDAQGGGGGGGSYVLPVATQNRLGGVKIGNGINVTNDGTISVSQSGGGFTMPEYVPKGRFFTLDLGSDKAPFTGQDIWNAIKADEALASPNGYITLSTENATVSDWNSSIGPHFDSRGDFLNHGTQFDTFDNFMTYVYYYQHFICNPGLLVNDDGSQSVQFLLNYDGPTSNFTTSEQLWYGYIENNKGYNHEMFVFDMYESGESIRVYIVDDGEYIHNIDDLKIRNTVNDKDEYYSINGEANLRYDSVNNKNIIDFTIYYSTYTPPEPEPEEQSGE